MLWNDMLGVPKRLLRVPFVRDVATMQVGVLISFACSFLASIVYVRLLGLDQYGRFAIVGAFAGLCAFLTNLGQQQTTATFFSEAYGQKDIKKMATAVRYYAFMTLVMWAMHAILIVLYPYLSLWIYGDESIGQLARLISIASMIDPLYNFLLIMLQTVRRIRLMTILSNIQNVIQLVAAVLLLYMGYGIAGILWSSIIGSVVLFVVALVLYPQLQRTYELPNINQISHAQNKTMWRHCIDGFWIAIDKNIGKQYPGIFIFVLSLSAPQTVVGLIRLAFRLVDLPATFGLGSVSTLANTVIPQLMNKPTEDSRKSLWKLFTHSIALHTGLSIAAAIIISPLITVVYGPAFAPTVYPFLIILTIHLSFALYILITPILRLRSKIWIGTIFNAVGMAGAVAIYAIGHFFTRDSVALYLAVIFYHLMNSLLVVPIWRMISVGPQVTNAR